MLYYSRAQCRNISDRSPCPQGSHFLLRKDKQTEYIKYTNEQIERVGCIAVGHSSGMLRCLEINYK